MKEDRWRLGMAIAMVVSLLLSAAVLVVGLDVLHKTTAKPAAGPATSMVTPLTGASLSGTVGMGATTEGSKVVDVEFLLTGGKLHGTKIATGVPSLIGWVAKWNTTTVANGIYVITSVAFNAEGRSGAGSHVSVVVNN